MLASSDIKHHARELGFDLCGVARAEDGSTKTFTVVARIDTPEELVAFSHGGILPYVLRQLVKKSQ